MGTLKNNEAPDEMLQGLHCFQRLKQSSGTENFNLIVFICMGKSMEYNGLMKHIGCMGESFQDLS